MRDVGDPHDPHEWLTQRAAAAVLHEDLGIHPETARRLLVAGLLGRPRATSLASFYRRDTVDAFVASQHERPALPVPDRNLVLVRVGNGRIRLGATEQHQLDRLSEGWRMSPMWRVLCRCSPASSCAHRASGTRTGAAGSCPPVPAARRCGCGRWAGGRRGSARLG